MNVTWHDAVAYTKWLSEHTSQTYRLPSEAEWEYSAQGGQDTKFWWGDEYIQGMDHCDSPSHETSNNTMSARLEGECSLRVSKGSSWLNPQPYVHLSKLMGIEVDYKTVLLALGY